MFLSDSIVGSLIRPIARQVAGTFFNSIASEDSDPSPDPGYIFTFDHTGSQVFDHLNQPVAVLQQFNNE
jgi:hypothetical protein